MIAGADSTDDLDVLRHGGMSRVLTGVQAPSTMGTFVRVFTFGHVRQLDAVAARLVAGQAAVVRRLLAGTQTLAFVDIDDTIREVHGYAKQGAPRSATRPRVITAVDAETLAPVGCSFGAGELGLSQAQLARTTKASARYDPLGSPLNRWIRARTGPSVWDLLRVPWLRNTPRIPPMAHPRGGPCQLLQNPPLKGTHTLHVVPDRRSPRIRLKLPRD
jgi:hypothetical protein